MNRQNFASTLAILLVLQTAIAAPNLATPYDLVDEVYSQIDDLRALVQGVILVAHDNLDSFSTNLLSYSNSIVEDGGIAIDQVHETVSSQLTQIKELAASANKDISRCTSGREQMINKLPTELKERLRVCVVKQNEEAANIVDGSKYVVDVVINKVDSLRFQVGSCDGSILCVSPIVTEVEKAKIELPQQIDVEVLEAEGFVGDLKVIVEECSDNNVADFTGYVTDLVVQISDCANKII
jgi:hypothetical protein